MVLEPQGISHQAVVEVDKLLDDLEEHFGDNKYVEFKIDYITPGVPPETTTVNIQLRHDLPLGQALLRLIGGHHKIARCVTDSGEWLDIMTGFDEASSSQEAHAIVLYRPQKDTE